MKENKNNSAYNSTTSYEFMGDIIIQRLLLIPIIISIALIPLIIRYHGYELHLDHYKWFSGASTEDDYFLYFKQLFMVISGICMLIFASCSIYFGNRKFKFHKLYIPLLIYVGMALLSTFLSTNRSFGLSGSLEQFETIFVQLSYFMLCYYTYLIIKTENDIKFIMRFLLGSITLLSILGLTQITGHNFIISDLGLKLLYPKKLLPYVTSVSQNFGDNGVFLTLLNPNYVGVYVLLVMPILFVLLIYCKKLLPALIYCFLILGMGISLLGSGSKTAILVMAVTFILMIVLVRKQLIKYYKLYLPIMILGLIAFSIVLIKFDLFTKIKSGLTATTSNTLLTDIQTNDDNVMIEYNGNKLYFQFYTDSSTYFYAGMVDESGNPIECVEGDTYNEYIASDERFAGITVKPILFEETYGFSVTIDGIEWDFTNQTEDGTYYYINNGKLDKMVKAKHSKLLEGYEMFASGRGYLWSRTLPLIKDHLLLGSGAETFLLEFPNNDYFYKNLYSFQNQTITKPHNLYLQIAVQYGFISLIAFIVFLMWYFISSIRLYIKGALDSYSKQIGAAILVSVTGYMISGLINDSTIAIGPVFWGLIGIGITVNELVKKEMNSKAK